MPNVSSRGRGRRAMNEINMVPFIDVMLVLLIIFMVTATVITPGAINIPRAGQSSKAPDQPVTVMIDAAGAVSADGGKNGPDLKGRSEGDIFAAIGDAAKSNPDLAVMVAADKDIAYQKVIDVTTRLRQAGVGRVGLAVR
ncbi:biopolymer transporter ExbD [Ottowia sp.]|jgi:biopolymer transport protein TolR|uniref:biopolymer transporter ExbD n=2 Tax=Ottowia sp. TaxID=1898956 RepID=UPI002CB3E243|nr:biopolymer transporter ExbD [Ottowia sp.]HOB66655.1 biopolymer transporter ExbD [Ottowia sp.]HPZ56971.1 biopolymer transporter ExbD [Ottowia sp.]HQD47468.1 biopolymer transporter ExbD [Ottowia sp.]